MNMDNGSTTGWQYQSGNGLPQSANDIPLQDRRSLGHSVVYRHPNRNMDEHGEDSFSLNDMGSEQVVANVARRRLPLLTTQTSVYMELPSRQIDSPMPDLKGKDDAPIAGVSGSSATNNRKSKFATLRIKKAAMARGRDQLCLDELADTICSNTTLMLETPESELMCLETIRATHCSLTLKRQLKRRVNEDKKMMLAARAELMTSGREQKKKRIGRRRRPAYESAPPCKVGYSKTFAIKQAFLKFKRKTTEIVNKLDFWDRHLRSIGGHFGVSTAYYFRFLKRLLILNIFSLVISVCFILVPQVLYTKFGYDIDGVNSTDSSEWKDPSPEYNSTTSSDDSFQWMDLMTGSGYLSQTALYYGAYVNFSINVDSEHYYNIPLAYLLATSCHLLVSLFLLAKWAGNAYKKHISVTHGYGAHTFCNLVFDSWDFSITSYEAAKQKRLGLTQELHERLQRLRPKGEALAWSARLSNITRFLVNNIISMTLLIGSGALVWDILYHDRLAMDIPILQDMAFSLVITAILVLLPFTFSMIVTWEGYKDKVTEVYATMFRMMLLLLIILGVFCTYWFMSNNSTPSTGDSTPDGADSNQDGGGTYCWETAFGEEIYRLQLVDFLVVHVFSLLAGFIYKFTLLRVLGNSEFNLAWNTWNLIYTQMLCWLGAFYVPEISGIIIIKLILVFYLKMIHIRVNCTPPAQPWGEFRTKIVFYSLAFFGSLAMLIPYGYTIIGMPPSQSCGPFRGNSFVYQVAVNVLANFKKQGETLAQIAYFLFLPGCVAAMLAILFAVAFQSKSHAYTTRHLVERLREQVMLEGKDKIFLLNMLTKAQQKLEQRNSVATPQPEQPSLYDSLRKQKAKNKQQNNSRSSQSSNKGQPNTVRFKLERPSITDATFYSNPGVPKRKISAPFGLPPLPPI